jgi:hypothetical protein
MNAVYVALKTTHKPRGDEMSERKKNPVADIQRSNKDDWYHVLRKSGTSSENVRHPCYRVSKIKAEAETTLKYRKLLL